MIIYNKDPQTPRQKIQQSNPSKYTEALNAPRKNYTHPPKKPTPPKGPKLVQHRK